MRRLRRTEQGQALVEFALISVVLFMLIFVVIEGAHLFQAQLTVQNAARAAGRYAVTGQFDETICDSAPPPCDVRLASIRAVAEEALTGLQLDPDAGFFDPAFYEIQVFGADASGNLIADSAGLAGRPVIIRVLYRVEVITPLLQPIAETVLVRGQTVMNNESPVRGRTGSSGNAPAVPALPPVGPTPTVAPPGPPDLYVDKSGPEKVLINATFPYRLEVGNIGEQNATGVILQDSLGGGGAIVGVTPADGCTWTATSATCDLGTLAPGAHVELIVNVAAGPDVTTLTNTATVAGAIAEDPGTGDNNSDQVVTSVVDETFTDLVLTKTGPSGDVWAESAVAFYLTVTNAGLLPATQITVTDRLPLGMAFQSAGSDPACGPDAPVGGRELVSCTAPSLAPGASTTFQINATAPVAAGSYTNESSVRLVSPVDSALGNNLSDFTFNVVRASDLWITNTGSPGTVNAGEQLTYLLTVGNDGPSAATNVTIDDVLPSSVAFVSATYSAPTGNGSCMRGGDVVTCNVGRLEKDETATATIAVVPQQGGTIINSAQVRTVETDPNTSNNSAVASNTITLLADLSIVKTAEPSPGGLIQSGQIMHYLLAATNNGPSAATGVVVTDTLTVDLLFVDASASQGYCSYDSGSRLVSCSLGRLSVSQTATVVIRVIPTLPSGGTDPGQTRSYVNTGYVSGNEPDDIDPNNARATTAVAWGPGSIQLLPSCGPAGTPVQVLGFNWRHNRDVTLSWRNNAAANTPISPPPDGLVGSKDISNSTYGFSRPVSFTVPATTENGVYFVRAFQEAQGPNLARTFDAPFKVPCDGPDLTVGPISNTASAEQGASVTFAANITNIGATAATGPFNVSLYFDPTLELTPTTHISGTYRQDLVTFTGLDAGDSQTVLFTVESLNAPVGTMPVYVVVDSDPAPEGTIAELNEANNLAIGELEVLSGDPVDPPTGSLTLTGNTWVELGPNSYELQPYVRVTVYSGTTRLASTYSAADGSYAFNALPQGGVYDIKACLVQNGLSYFALLVGQIPDVPWIETLWLVQGPCS